MGDTELDDHLLNVRRSLQKFSANSTGTPKTVWLTHSNNDNDVHTTWPMMSDDVPTWKGIPTDLFSVLFLGDDPK